MEDDNIERDYIEDDYMFGCDSSVEDETTEAGMHENKT